MSLSTVLKTIGKDLSHVGSWIDDGVKVAIPIIGVVDPPLGMIFTEIEKVLVGVTSTTTGSGLTAAQVQQIVTAVATLMTLKVTLPTTSTTTTSTTATVPVTKTS